MPSSLCNRVQQSNSQNALAKLDCTMLDWEEKPVAINEVGSFIVLCEWVHVCFLFWFLFQCLGCHSIAKGSFSLVCVYICRCSEACTNQREWEKEKHKNKCAQFTCSKEKMWCKCMSVCVCVFPSTLFVPLPHLQDASQANQVSDYAHYVSTYKCAHQESSCVFFILNITYTNEFPSSRE